MSVDIGVLGVGTISTAIVEGIRSSKLLSVVNKVFLSPRGRQNVEKLLPLSSNNCVCKTNQEVLDSAAVLVVGIHHKHLPQIFSELSFKREHKIILVTAATPIEKVHDCTSNIVPLENITRCITLPAVKYHKGTTFLFPQNDLAYEIFSNLGNCFVSKSEDEYSKISALFCVMGDFYNRMNVTIGIDKDLAQKSLISCFETFLEDAKQRKDEENVFNTLVQEQTPGGLNEQVIKFQEEKGAYDVLEQSLRKLINN
eukprot:maker-scaffold_3-snap-gene-9.51-mRNA-1 protein AED:0.03 eAED:0.03 QI:63/0.66/0.5/1/0.33/0.25/4/0/254